MIGAALFLRQINLVGWACGERAMASVHNAGIRLRLNFVFVLDAVSGYDLQE
ncbi:MAG: hypothetical protein AAGU11_13940 [Syntrophobacteraceae bacterium]